MSTFDALSGITNAAQATPTMVTGGQPTADQLAAFKAAGGAVVLDIRDPMEPRPYDEPAKARELGLEYVNIPFVGGRVGTEQFERITEVLRANKDREVLFHCASGNRTAGALIPFLILDLGMGEEDATDLAMRLGLRSSEYLQMGLEYAAAHGG